MSTASSTVVQPDGDLLGLGALLGHRSLDTTHVYTGPTAAQYQAKGEARGLYVIAYAPAAG